MSDALVLEFRGVTSDQYDAVNQALGINTRTGEGDSPAGLLSHTGAMTAGGDLMVLEVWDSQELQGTFMADRLGAALGQAGLPNPTRVEWLTVVGHHNH